MSFVPLSLPATRHQLDHNNRLQLLIHSCIRPRSPLLRMIILLKLFVCNTLTLRMKLSIHKGKSRLTSDTKSVTHPLHLLSFSSNSHTCVFTNALYAFPFFFISHFFFFFRLRNCIIHFHLNACTAPFLSPSFDASRTQMLKKKYFLSFFFSFFFFLCIFFFAHDTRSICQAV